MKISFSPYNKSLSVPSSYPIYFHSKYLEVQRLQNLFLLTDHQNIQCLFNLSDGVAKSLDRCPFGSFTFIHPGVSIEDFRPLHEHLINILAKRGMERIEITHPPSCYSNFIPKKWLNDIGYEITWEDINQHIDLKMPVNYHNMENRKLKKLLDGTRIENSHDIDHFHDFISNARRVQGLDINIEIESLKALMNSYPDQYTIWIAKINNEWAAAVLTVQVNSEAVYYYLPGTDTKFKPQSPMVVLMDHLINHYKLLGIHFLDLGISSIQGIKQQGLFDFKQRMGAQSLSKVTFRLDL